MTSLPAIHAGDSLTVRIDVVDGDNPLDLTGATVEATAVELLSGVALNVASSITNALAGEFFLTVPAATLQAGLWTLQVRVTLPTGEAQTIVEVSLPVQRSVVGALKG